MTLGGNKMSHDDPIKDIFTKAIESYGKDTDDLVKFELSAFIFFRVFNKLTKKSKRETASLMIILVQGIWRSGAKKLFVEKRKCASVLMNRMKRFKAAGLDNQVKELLFHIKSTKESRTPELIDLQRSRDGMEAGLSHMSLPSEESLSFWISSLSGIMAGLAGLVRKESTCMLAMPEQKKDHKRTFWKWIFWFLAGSAALGSMGVICT